MAYRESPRSSRGFGGPGHLASAPVGRRLAIAMWGERKRQLDEYGTEILNWVIFCVRRVEQRLNWALCGYEGHVELN